MTLLLRYTTICILVSYSFCTDIFNNCNCEENQEGFAISCKQFKILGLKIYCSWSAENKIQLKLLGINIIQLMNDEDINQFNIITLDLSNNQNNMDYYLKKINSFETLNQLNLSSNKISILSNNAFNKLLFSFRHIAILLFVLSCFTLL